MRNKVRAVAAGLILALSGVAAVADVTLTAKSGTVTVTGKLTGFDGEFYDLETPDGPVTIDARSVTCAGADCPPADAMVSRFALAGTSVAPGLMTALMESFALSQEADLSVSDTRLTVSSGQEVLAEIDILPDGGDTAAAPTADAPVLRLTDTAPGDQGRATVIARDAVVAGVAATNTIDGLSTDQIAAVAAGTITNWSALGGPDAPINLHAAPLPAGAEAAARAAGWMPGDTTQKTTHARTVDAADEAANDPYGIAILPLSGLRRAKALALRGSCGISVAADGFNTLTGAYPVVFDLAVERPAIRMPVFAREFLEFLDSDAARNVIADFGFVPIAVTDRALDNQGQRLANMILTIGDEVSLADAQALARMMSGAKRLSPTFRFRPGSTRLDSASRASAGAFAAELRLGRYADKVVVLAGFSDAAGGAAQNARLSAKRAEAVRDALMAEATDGALDDVTFEVQGYGEAAPLVCEDDAAGAAVNRRVEVWVRDRETGTAD